MLVVIASAVGSEGARAGVRRAAAMAADIVLMGEAVGMARRGGLEGFCGTAFVVEEDLKASGLDPAELEKGAALRLRAHIDAMLAAGEEVERY